MTAQRHYQRLMASGGGDSFDRHLLACPLALALADPSRPAAEGLGLSAVALAEIAWRVFPALVPELDSLGDGAAAAAIEEPDLRRLLRDNRSDASPLAGWLAAIVARRSLETNHLWQDLGLRSRADLSELMKRHFAPLAARNSGDMKWKKFFYRQLCLDEGTLVCKSPVCESCDDFGHCFGAEDGLSLLAG